jgi:Asp-tRNA(Asn)/Glu-tRNA(Gln) amidotransferase A subunit family amidase
VSELTATEAARRIRAGELTSVELVQSCLDRIAEREPDVQAWAHLDSDQALAQARARDEEEPRGPLHGVPVGVKDLIDTADMPTTYGSPIYAGHQPTEDAACVTRLREAGAVILGKTVTTEFALFHPGKTRNPHDAGRTPGGSSSGSAAAVADGMVPLTVGSQTAGSVVRPAAFCGAYGLKPTFGTVPLDGVRPCAPSLDTLGVFARSAEDLLLGWSVLAGREPVALPQLSGVRIGFARTYEWERAEPATRAALEDLASTLAATEVDLPREFAGLVEAQQRIMVWEAARSLAVEREQHPDQLSATLKSYLATADEVDERQVEDARALTDTCRSSLDEVFAELHALVSPAVVGEPPHGLDATGDPLFCRIWTLLGVPAVAVPGLRGPDGLPLGFQVLGPHGEDERAVAAARWVGVRIGEEVS